MSEPFCMVSFIGNLGPQTISFRLNMMTYVAALRFEQAPCPCEGCQKFSADVLRYGRSKALEGKA